MGKNKRDKPAEDFASESTAHACGTCWYSKANAVNADRLDCPFETETVGRADSCGEWTATEPENTEDKVQQVVEQITTIADSDITEAISGDVIATEMPSASPTTDFHLYKIEGFAHEFGIALAEVYNYFSQGGVGPVAVSIKLTGFEETVKASMSVTLPHTVRLESMLTEVVRENGEFRILLPAQTGLFEKEAAAT